MIEWQWVKAHNGNPMNEKVDKLARDCAERNKNKNSLKI
jgi:ribonuclease HI